MGQCHTSPKSKKYRLPSVTSLPSGQKTSLNRKLTKNTLHYPLTFLPESSETSISFNKLGKISLPDKIIIKSTCYIPERNLFLVLPMDFWEIYIYSIRKKFKLIARKMSNSELNAISYSKELDKILMAGNYLQLWSPVTFKIEARSPQQHELIHNLMYLPNIEAFVSKTPMAIYLYNQDLIMISRFELPSIGGALSSTAEFFYISQGLLLAVCRFEQTKSLLLNINKETVKELDQLYIPCTSCVEMTQETPNKIFTCLTSLTRDFSVVPGQPSSFKLTQFSIDPTKEELIISRVTKRDRSFHSLYRLKYQKYFLAEGFNQSNTSEIFLLSIEKDQVEIIRFLSEPINSLVRSSEAFLMIKSVILHVKEGNILLYGCVLKQKKRNKLQEINVSHETLGLHNFI